MKKKLNKQSMNNKIKTSYRARIKKMDDGTMLIVPVAEGSRGPRYNQMLQTRHARVLKNQNRWKVEFDLPSLDAMPHLCDCINNEIPTIMSYLYKHII